MFTFIKHVGKDIDDVAGVYNDLSDYAHPNWSGTAVRLLAWVNDWIASSALSLLGESASPPRSALRRHPIQQTELAAEFPPIALNAAAQLPCQLCGCMDSIEGTHRRISAGRFALFARTEFRQTGMCPLIILQDGAS